MTTTLSARGQIVIPSGVRNKLGLRVGDDFIVLCSARREILLRPVHRRGRKGLIKAIRSLQGLELSRQDEPVRDLKL
jgi:AbrB family looped-hinge helix DNA binding protein